MLEVLHELVDAVASLRAITGNRQAELHARLDQAAEVPAGDKPAPERGPFEPKVKSAADVPAGT